MMGSTSALETLLFNHSSKLSLYMPIRQVDQVLIDVLNKVRACRFDEDNIRFINERAVHKSDISPSCLRLYATRKNVNKANSKEIKRLSGNPISISAHDSIYNGSTRKATSRALKEKRLLKELELKPDMPVMLIQNLRVSRGWVNGTLAKFREIDEENILLVKQA